MWYNNIVRRECYDVTNQMLRSVIMKKAALSLTMLAILSSMASCGSIDDSGINGEVLNETTTASAVKTIMNISPVTTVATSYTVSTALTDSVVSTVSNVEKETTALISAVDPNTDEKPETVVTESEPIAPVINENERLFGGYVSTQSDDRIIRQKPNTNSKAIVQTTTEKPTAPPKYAEAVESEPVIINAESYLGTWYDSRCIITISESDDSYIAEITQGHQPGATLKHETWNYKCTYSESEAAMICSEGVYIETDDTGDGEHFETVHYEDGTAVLKINVITRKWSGRELHQFELLWQDDKDDAGAIYAFNKE